MARRPLPKIDSSLDLSLHLLTPEQLPKPWNSTALFGRAAPLEIEVGSGKGLFLAQSAIGNPAHDFIGIELAARYAHFCGVKLAKLAVCNARMVHGKAEEVFANFLPDASVTAVHIYFPDPWWKKRHRKRRVMSEHFVGNIERVLRPGGTLHFWTDVEEYYHATLAMVSAATSLAGPFEVSAKPAEHDLDFRTHFERRMRLHGEQVYRCEFRKSLK